MQHDFRTSQSPEFTFGRPVPPRTPPLSSPRTLPPSLAKIVLSIAVEHIFNVPVFLRSSHTSSSSCGHRKVERCNSCFGDNARIVYHAGFSNSGTPDDAMCIRRPPGSRTLTICQRDDVVLSGGSTRSPYVQMIQEFVNKQEEKS